MTLSKTKKVILESGARSVIEPVW